MPTKDHNKKVDDSSLFEEAIEEEFDGEIGSCQSCGGKLKVEKSNREEFEGGKLYAMENVMVYMCEDCGEMWVPEPIMIEFENMINIAKKYSHKKEVESHKKESKSKKLLKIKKHFVKRNSS